MANKYHIKQATEKATGGKITYTPKMHEPGVQQKDWVYTNKSVKERAVDNVSQSYVKHKVKSGKKITQRDLNRSKAMKKRLMKEK
jgi:hypothetical protein